MKKWKNRLEYGFSENFGRPRKLARPVQNHGLHGQNGWSGDGQQFGATVRFAGFSAQNRQLRPGPFVLLLFFLIPISIFNPFSHIFSLSNSFPTIFTPFISILLSKSSIPSQFLSNLLQDFTYPSYFLCFEPNNLSFQPPNHQNQPRGTILLQELGKISISYFLYITSRISKVSLMFWRVSCAMFWIPWERLILLIVGTFLCFYLVNLISVWWFKLLENDGISMTWVLHASWILFRNCVFILWCVIHDYFISSRTCFDFSLRLQGMRNRESDW